MPRPSASRVIPAITFPTEWWQRVKVVAALRNVQPAVFCRQAIMQQVGQVEAEHGIEGGLSPAQQAGRIKGG